MIVIFSENSIGSTKYIIEIFYSVKYYFTFLLIFFLIEYNLISFESTKEKLLSST